MYTTKRDFTFLIAPNILPINKKNESIYLFHVRTMISCKDFTIIDLITITDYSMPLILIPKFSKRYQLSNY